MPHFKLSPLSQVSLRTRSGMVLAGLLLVLWAFIAYDLSRVREMTEAVGRNETSTLVRAFAEEVNSSVNSVDHTLIDLRDQWKRDPEDFANIVARRQAYLERDLAFQVTIVDVSGRIAYTSMSASPEQVNLSDREHFAVHRQRGVDQLFISKPVVGRLTNRWTIQFTRPLSSDAGVFSGVIVLSVPAEYFSRFYNTIDIGADSTITLVRATGEVLARSPNPEDAMGKSLSGAPFMGPGSPNFGLYAERSQEDGIERLFGWRVLPKGRLMVVIGRTYDTLLLPYREQRRIYVTGGAIVSVLLGLMAIFLTQGIAQRAAAARSLRASHARVAAEKRRIKVLLENSHDAFVAVDTNGAITDWNGKAESLFGWRASEVIGHDLGQLLVPPELQRQYQDLFHRFSEGGNAAMLNQVIELEGLDSQRQRIPLEVAVAAFHTEDGYAANAFIRDIRARKEFELLEAQRQRSLEQTRLALQHSQKLESVGKLTGGVAHDFNNVLQIIGGSLQLLERFASGNDAAARRVENAMRAVERGSKLSMQLLAFARRQPLQPVVVNLRKLIVNMDDLLKQGVGESVEIRSVIDEGLWNTQVDPNQLESVILNLAINARDAMEGRGKLTIELSNQALAESSEVTLLDVPAGEYVVIAVSDTGSGMTAEVLERAFEPFFTTKPEGQGTGLGLSMAYGFVKQSGGDIRIYSEPGHGTTFRLYLPRAPGPESALPRPVDTSPRGGSETILVVEDDLEVQSVVVAMLSELGYKVLRANDAASALLILESGAEIDLLFTDVVMPGLLRGPELAQQARRIHPDIAVLYTSGYTREAIMHDGRLEEGVGLLSKPYRRDQLASKVRYFLSGKRQDAALPGNGQPVLESTIVKAGLETLAYNGNSSDESVTTDTAGRLVNIPASPNTTEQKMNKTSDPVPAMPANETVSAAGLAPVAAAVAATNATGHRILVVEDNEDLLMLACEMLNILGHDAVAAESGERALELLATDSFTVLLTDIGLPGINGVELARQVNAAHPSMKIIYASGYGDSADLQAGFAFSILKKPYNMGQLKICLA